MQKYFAEFTGSFFFVLALGLTGDALSSGLLLIGIIYIGREISGAHFNPAVSLAFWAAGRMQQKTLWLYVASQIAGAVAGGLLIFTMAGTSFQTVPATSATPLQYTIIELLFGFLLAMVYLILFTTRYFHGNQVYGLIIGLTYTGILLVGGPVTGGVFNPSIAMSASLIDYFNYGDSYFYLPAYIFASASGGVIAGNLLKAVINSGDLLTEEDQT